MKRIKKTSWYFKKHWQSRYIEIAHGTHSVTHPRGSIYIAVLAMSMIITIIGVAGISTAMIERKQVEQTNDYSLAQYHAQSAVQLAILRINNNPNWRDGLTDGMLFENLVFSGGEISAWTDVAADGINDPITVRGYGYHGQSRFIICVELIQHVDEADTLPAHIINDGAVAYWPMDEAGGTVVNDVISSNHGQCINNPTFGHEGIGLNSTCIRFYGGGQNTYVNIDHSNDFYIDEGTVELWCKLAQPHAEAGLFSKDAKNYCDGGHFYIGMWFDKFITRLQSINENIELYDADLPAVDAWYHCVSTFGSGGFKFYVNAQVVDSTSYFKGLATSTGGTGNMHPIAIGAYNIGSSCTDNNTLERYFNGYIDEVAFYNQPLTTEQIQTHYTLGTQPVPLSVIPGSWRRIVDQ